MTTNDAGETNHSLQGRKLYFKMFWIPFSFLHCLRTCIVETGCTSLGFVSVLRLPYVRAQRELRSFSVLCESALVRNRWPRCADSKMPTSRKVSLSESPVLALFMLGPWHRTVHRLSARHNRKSSTHDPFQPEVEARMGEEQIPISTLPDPRTETACGDWAAETITATHHIAEQASRRSRDFRSVGMDPSDMSPLELLSEDAFCRKLVAGRRRVEHELGLQHQAVSPVTTM